MTLTLRQHAVRFAIYRLGVTLKWRVTASEIARELNLCHKHVAQICNQYQWPIETRATKSNHTYGSHCEPQPLDFTGGFINGNG